MIAKFIDDICGWVSIKDDKLGVFKLVFFIEGKVLVKELEGVITGKLAVEILTEGIDDNHRGRLKWLFADKDMMQ